MDTRWKNIVERMYIFVKKNQRNILGIVLVVLGTFTCGIMILYRTSYSSRMVLCGGAAANLFLGSGMTTMYMDVGMDTGDMILKEEVEIGDDETTGELWDRLSKIGGELLVKTLEQIENGTAPRTKQGEDFTVAPMLDKQMAKIDWNEKTASEIKNLVRGLNPIMGAYTFLNGKKIKFWKVAIATKEEIMAEDMEILRNGTVMVSDPRDGLFIKAKDGIIKVLEIQGENAKRMPIADFLRGNVINEFEVFE